MSDAELGWAAGAVLIGRALGAAATRGRLVSLYQMATVIGILVAYATTYALSGFGVNNWRWMFAAQLLPPALFWFALLAVPRGSSG